MNLKTTDSEQVPDPFNPLDPYNPYEPSNPIRRNPPPLRPLWIIPTRQDTNQDRIGDTPHIINFTLRTLSNPTCSEMPITLA